MPGCRNDGYRSVAELDFLPIVGDNVTFWFSLRIPVDGFLDGVPVGTAHYDVGPESILHEFGSADVIGMRVADDYVLHRSRIEAQLFQSAHNLFLRVVGE